jgi:histone-arginine methyltransferase CARM1
VDSFFLLPLILKKHIGIKFDFFLKVLSMHRLELIEPLAVNAHETVRGWLRMVVNPMRSYDLTAEVVSGKTATLSDPKEPLVESRGADYGRRISKWALHEQTYYFDQYATDSATKPEFLGLYEPDNSQ